MADIVPQKSNLSSESDTLQGIGHIHITFPREWFAQMGVEVNERIVAEVIRENVLTRASLSEFELVQVTNVKGDYKVMLKRKGRIGGNVLDFGRIELGTQLSLIF